MKYTKNFPNGFYNSRNGTMVKNENIDKWIQDGINELEKTGTNDYYVRSGDSIVIVSRLHEEDGGGFEIIVSNHYYETTVGNSIDEEELDESN